MPLRNQHTRSASQSLSMEHKWPLSHRTDTAAVIGLKISMEKHLPLPFSFTLSTSFHLAVTGFACQPLEDIRAKASGFMESSTGSCIASLHSPPGQLSKLLWCCLSPIPSAYFKLTAAIIRIHCKSFLPCLISLGFLEEKKIYFLKKS